MGELILSFKPTQLSMTASKHGIELRLFSDCMGDMCVDDWLNRRLERVSANITLHGKNQFTDAKGFVSKDSMMKINLDDDNALADIAIYADDAKLLALLPFLDKRIDQQTDMNDVILQIYIDEPSEYPLKGTFKINSWEIHAH